MGSLGLRARVTLAWGVIALVLSSSLAFFAYAVTRSHLVEERESNARSQSYLNARFIRGVLRSGDQQVGDALPQLQGGSESRALARVAGEWFSESVAVSPSSLPASLTRQATEGRAARQIIEMEGEPFVAVGVGIPEFNAQYYELVSVGDIRRTLGVLAQRLSLVAGICTLLGAGIGWLVSGRILRPLSQFSSAAERIAEGGLDTRIAALKDRDLRVLARSFNHMADAVQKRIDREARFTSQLSHELRSPVAALFSAINVARRRKSPSENDQILDDMEGRVKDLHALVEDLLELSRFDSEVSNLQLEPVDPAAFVRTQLARLGKGDVPVKVGDGVPTEVMLDKRRLAQVLQNLIDNAERYAGGVTAIRVESRNSSQLRLVVEDEGPGIPEEESGLVFERFTRGQAALRSPHSGAGLGLSLVSEHVTLHGGKVVYQPRPGGGSKFVVELPLEPNL